jgi:hypothetical protein
MQILPLLGAAYGTGIAYHMYSCRELLTSEEGRALYPFAQRFRLFLMFSLLYPLMWIAHFSVMALALSSGLSMAEVVVSLWAPFFEDKE